MVMRFVDIDGHVLEPSGLWVENLEGRYKGRAMRFVNDDEGLETWIIDGLPNAKLSKKTSANLATIGMSADWRRENIFEKRALSWEDGRALQPAACDPHERVKLMDAEGIDASVLYPSLGLSWMGTTRDPGLAAAYCRVYNDWIIAFCKAYPQRLFPAITLPWSDVPESVGELRRTAASGPRVIMTPSHPPHDIPYGDPHWDPVWTELEEQDVPVGLHPASGGSSPAAVLHPNLQTVHWWGFTMGAVDMQITFASLFQGALFERFSRLNLVVLESGCLWMPYLLERMDDKFKVLGFTTPMKHKPSEYFHRQCFVDMDPDDELAPIAAQLLGADRLMWAYDYPHSDSAVNPIVNLKNTLGGLSEEDQRKIAGENATSLFRLPTVG